MGFKTQIFEAIGLNSSAEVSIEMFFGKIGLFLNLFVVCSFNFLMRHTDGKNSSATAPLVQYVQMILQVDILERVTDKEIEDYREMLENSINEILICSPGESAITERKKGEKQKQRLPKM